MISLRLSLIFYYSNFFIILIYFFFNLTDYSFFFTLLFTAIQSQILNLIAHSHVSPIAIYSPAYHQF